MDYSGPATRSLVEEDLALSDDEEWPLMPPGDHQASPAATVEAVATLLDTEASNTGNNPSSAKRLLNSSSDSNDALSQPAAKTAKQGDTSVSHDKDSTNSPAASPSSVPCNPPLTSQPLPAFPAFAPRDEYVKLFFRDNPSVETKLRWLSEVNTNFSLDRNLAEVKMSAVTSRFVYVSRKRVDVIDSITKGEFLSLFLDAQDSSQRPRKFPTYLLTRYPVCVDPSLAKALHGVYRAKRFIQDGAPINRIVITWSLPDPPPPFVTFNFLPSLPSCEVRRMKDEQPWCFRCWGVGHISRYCSRPEKCAWCSGQHHSLTCPHRPQSSPNGSASTSKDFVSPAQGSDSPPVDTSQWQCPRCRQSGVNVWHGCTRRPANSAVPPTLAPQSAQRAPATPHAASPPVSDASSVSPEVASLQAAVALMKSQCSSYTARLEAIERRMDEFVSQQAEMNTKISVVMEAQQAFSVTITNLAEKIDSLATHIERITTLPSASSLSRGAQQSAAHAAPSTSLGRSKLRGSDG